jgi:rod shape-determining protein MreB and related proteins
VLRAPTLALDLGNANTRVYHPGRGVVVDEPSLVALGGSDRSLIATGSPVKAMMGRAHAGVIPIHPLRHGVVFELDATERMLRAFIQAAGGGRHPRLLVSVPTGTTSVERRSVEQAAHSCGASSVTVIEEPLAAAIGAGLPVERPLGGMLVDVGAGITESVVVSMGGIVTARSVRIAGDDMDEAIAEHVLSHHGVAIGLPTAERVKIAIGATHTWRGAATMAVVGVHRASGLPRRVTLTSTEVSHALEPAVRAIVGVVVATLESTPPELSADLAESGMMMTGGLARLRGLPERVANETGVTVTVSPRPDRAVVDGSGRCVEEPRFLAAIAR